MSKYFKGRFLLSKIVVTVIILGLIILNQYGVISNTVNAIFMLISLVAFFVANSKFRKNEQYN